MNSLRGRLHLLAFSILLLVLTAPAFSQVLTGTITGRAADSSGALIPGVEVSITSPAMIGGARSAVTDEQGTYRFTQLPPGVYRVTFALQGFKTLNIDGVNVTVGNTMTINATVEVASVAEEVTVTSQAPTIDLEAASVAVNWSQQKLDNLPYGRDILGFVAMIPGTYTTQYDVGGNTMGGPAGAQARVYGRSGGASVMYDGVVWDQSFGDYGSYEEIQVSTAAKGAEAMNPGATFSLIIKSGSNNFHGTAYAAWEDGSFQSNNVNQKLLNRGFLPSSNKFTRYNDYNFDLGGRFIRDKLWFYAGYADTYSGQYIPGFISEKTGQQVVYFVKLRIPTLKLTYQLNDKMKLDAVAQASQKWAPYREGSQYVTSEAAHNQKSTSVIGPKLKWTYIINPKMTADAEFTRSGYWWPSYPWTPDIRKTDLTTTNTRGAFLRTYRRPIRWQWDGNWTWFTDLGGRHNEIKTGFLGWWDKSFVEDWGYPNQQLYRYRSLQGETNYFLHPDSVQVFDYPNYRTDVVDYNSWFVNDKMTLSRRLTLNVGLRFDHYTSYLPQQGNPGLGPFSTKNLYPERHDFPVYNSWVPRFSVVYDVKGDGKLALKASYGRYAGGGSGTSTSPGPRANDVNPAAATTWTYNNWDGSIPYKPVAANLASVSGGAGNRRLDNATLDNAYMDEYTAGMEYGLRRDYLVRFNIIRKMDYGGSKILDLAQPYSAYTDVRSAVDPGRDNVVGTADDGIMYAWSVPRTYPTFGQINQFITNVDKDEGNALYTAYEATLNKQYSSGWSFLASWTGDFAKIGNKKPQNPNVARYNWQIPVWHYTVKLNGTYDLPWYGLKYGTTYLAQSGEPYGRSAQMRNALNSLVTVQVEGIAGYYNWVKLWDNRVSKLFKVGDRGTIEAMFDLYNTLNSSVVLSQVTVNGPDYGKPVAQGGSATQATSIAPARIFKLGARWRF